MNKEQQAKPGKRNASGKHDKPDRLDTIEEADNRTERLDPERASATTDPVQDMLEAGETNADYRDEANRRAPTLGPSDPAADV
ncbi:hypothetical protein [Frateuria terrea]|uniref:Uncharacterized protein n=1 Tax=Frateuria terrea TaxID=529704 RepID=A0A1H6VRQ1_9GAMM|nr:hypothetical protein [Frateuria terrea]SEJ07348.1 hypothetical protein SAMN04487997_2418 [Frateuria terrea]SFP69726.1 hypothetical protein SAMN02927913_3235 [Frateuria terrea]